MRLFRTLSLEVECDEATLLARAAKVLPLFGFAPTDGVQFKRSGTLAGALLGKVEQWPAVLELRTMERAYGTRVDLAVEVNARLHLAGSVDQRLVEADLRLLCRGLTGRPIPPRTEVLNLLRQPVRRSARLNALLAAFVVGFIGQATGVSWSLTLMAMALVGFFDLVVIHAFADHMLEADRRLEERLSPETEARPTHDAVESPETARLSEA